MQAGMALDLLLGLGLGYVSGTFGITGGVIALPILGLLGFGQQLAQGTSLVMQLPIGVVALWQYARRSSLNKALIAATASGSAVATFIGARLAVHLPEESMRKGFAVFLAALATFTICSAFWRQAASGKLRWASASAIGAGGGFCSGLLESGAPPLRSRCSRSSPGCRKRRRKVRDSPSGRLCRLAQRCSIGYRSRVQCGIRSCSRAQAAAASVACRALRYPLCRRAGTIGFERSPAIKETFAPKPEYEFSSCRPFFAP